MYNKNLDETKTFGPLEIKILRCGKVKSNNKFNDVCLYAGQRYDKKSK